MAGPAHALHCMAAWGRGRGLGFDGRDDVTVNSRMSNAALMMSLIGCLYAGSFGDCSPPRATPSLSGSPHPKKCSGW